MYLPKTPSMKETLHSVRNTLLATIFIATQLVACGGGGSGSDVVASSSTGSSVPLSSDATVNNTDVSALPGDAGNDSVTPVPATGSFSLSWTAPTTRSDGTPLSLADIDGFRIYYGKSKGSYPNSVDVRDGSAQSAVVKNIPVGSYYVVMTTYDVTGLESGYSSAISKNVF
jgi:hypothetical protein